VLIIDDESGIRAALQRWFARKGWITVVAQDGEEALTVIRASGDDDASRLDVIVCDLHLPKLTGIELYAALQTESPDILDRLIFTTGDTVADAERGSVLASHHHVLQKPFELSALRAMVQSIMPEA
jgi:CheY-like chemotaxis protein